MTRRAVKIAAKKAARKVADKKPAARKPATTKPKPKPKEADVDGFFAALEHPLKKEYDALRKAVLGADKRISEGVKWNSVSFKTSDYFATINLRSADAVQLVMHRGAKSKSGEKAMDIADPKGLLKWLSSDRALLTLGAGPAFGANLPALKKIVAAWITQI